MLLVNMDQEMSMLEETSLWIGVVKTKWLQLTPVSKTIFAIFVH